MPVIGITGSIASGKTALLEFLSEKKYIIFSCDAYVKELYQDPKIINKIEANFPELEGFNRVTLAQIIYSDVSKRKKLEEIIHPLVAKGLEEFLSNVTASKSDIIHGLLRHDVTRNDEFIFLEIPLLFEAGFEKYCDYIITLLCPYEVRLERALARGLTKEMFESIDKAQIPEEKKAVKSDFTINTNVEWKEEIAEFERVIGNI